MKSRMSLIGCIVMLTVGCSPSWGQPPGSGRGRPGGPFRGPGGPAMEAPLMLMLGMAEVRKELGITRDQQAKLDELANHFQKEMQAAFEFQQMLAPDEQQQPELLEMVREGTEALVAQSDRDILKVLTERQKERLDQLQLQQAGVNAFRRPDVVKKLELSNEQQTKITSISQSDFRRFGPPGLGGIDQQRGNDLATVLALLSDEQKARWAAMTGKEFHFPTPPFGGGGPGFGPGGPMGAGPMGGGPMGGLERELVDQYDKDGNGWLNQEERQLARASQSARGGRPGGGPGGRRGRPMGGSMGRGNREAAQPGRHLSSADVESYPNATLYEPSVLRTIFLNFEDDDWETEMEDFKGSDVDVPATLIVDGRTYPRVGVHFRGLSSYMSIPTGYKRSLNVSLDLADKDQRLYGYKTLNLLNCHGDSSLMSTVLYSHIARQYIPAPNANFVRVVINGECWGIYVNVQQFDKVFVAENYKGSKGTRWKVSGNPGADGGLRYVGESLDEYKRRYEMKSNDGNKAWQALIDLCRTLDETPLEELESKLEPILDIDNVLWFLALDVALVNSDGYWTRASDYSLFRDANGKFHITPHDMNEAFHGMGGPGGFGPPGGPGGFGPPGGPGGFRPPEGFRPPAGFGPQDDFRPLADAARARGRGEADRSRRGGRGFGGPGGGGPGGGGVTLDPLVGLDNRRMPLRSRLLQVPALRAKYLRYIRTIADKSLDWRNLGPVVAGYRELIADDVQQETRGLTSPAEFLRATADELENSQGRGMSLRAFAEQRRAYLLEYQAPQGVGN